MPLVRSCDRIPFNAPTALPESHDQDAAILATVLSSRHRSSGEEMDARVLKDMVATVRAERRRRKQPLTGEDDDSPHDRWLFVDEPFVNELCLVLLVALRHELERELVRFAARSRDDGRQIGGKRYEQTVREAREDLRKRGGWGRLAETLKIKSCAGYTELEALRLLANSYKHDPWKGPSRDLLQLLRLDANANYARLAESDALREKLAVLIGLEAGADYCEIADRFVDVASEFVSGVQKHVKLSPIRRGPISLNPSDFAR